MSKPIRATRDNLKPGTIWQNAAGSRVFKVLSVGSFFTQVAMIDGSGVEEFQSKVDILRQSDLWYQVQPIKEPTT